MPALERDGESPTDATDATDATDGTDATAATDANAEPTGRDDPVPESVRRLVCCRITGSDRSGAAVGRAIDDPVATARRVADADRVTGAVAVETCERAAVFVATRTAADRETGIRAAREALGVPDPRVERGRTAVEHLTRLACGLESPILGEDHVLGQLRRAFEAAREADLAGGVLTRAADAALAAGRSVRDETRINEGTVDYGSAACDVVAGRSGAPDRLVVVGTGEIGAEVVSAATARWDLRVDAVSRSPESDLPAGGGETLSLGALPEAVADADAVVTATGATDPVFGAEAAAALPRTATVVDLATPPDAAPAVRENDPRVVGLDAVRARVADGLSVRRAAAPAVERRVAAAVERFLDREREARAEDTLRALHREAKAVREAELERARTRLDAGDTDPEAVLEDAMRSLTASLLATPTERLKEAARAGDGETIDAADRLFDLDRPNDR
ncbi:glutamyl-tRNA reductase [Halorubrum salipaludis]|uniref:Glutamyl-tRNA reductase n=1 Tax=Halorubrum salipaludis TaxID=2032630 RepID=A0A2A2FEF2_9EURY|nr:glutamyl-tRNA reductase [Halorubrum salipaludis]PAU83338.1 glutamyl-tRNA reductase [Halorubrum salipaludis]